MFSPCAPDDRQYPLPWQGHLLKDLRGPARRHGLTVWAGVHRWAERHVRPTQSAPVRMLYRGVSERMGWCRDV